LCEHSPPSIAEVKDAWSYTSTPQFAFMTWCSVKAQGQLYLYLTCQSHWIMIVSLYVSVLDVQRL